MYSSLKESAASKILLPMQRFMLVYGSVRKTDQSVRKYLTMMTPNPAMMPMNT